jgi:hypothetical protein
VALVKSITIDLGVKNAGASMAKLFPAFTAKIDTAAAAYGAVFRGQPPRSTWTLKERTDLIFRLFTRVAVKLGDERHVYDRKTFTFADAQRVEEAAGLAYPEWEFQLGRGSVTAVAALLHVLRVRDGQPSDFKTMSFNMADLDAVPLHDDDSEYTAGQVAEELDRRVREARDANDPGPTPAAGAPALPSGEDRSAPPWPTSPSSPAATASARGNGTSSRTRTSSSSRGTLTPT